MISNSQIIRVTFKCFKQSNPYIRAKCTFTSPLNMAITQSSAAAAPNVASKKSENEAESQSNLKTRLFAAVCIERMPVITSDMNDLEKRYMNLINEMNIRNSYLSDHELRQLKDLKRLKKKGKSKEENELMIESASDYEEKCLKSLKAMKFGERKLSDDFDAKMAKSDEASNSKFRNFDYVLDKKLILLVNEPNMSDWRLPKMEWSENDVSLRATAERAIRNLEEKLQVDFLGNAPFGVYKTKTDDKFFDKYYFFKAQYKSGAESLAQSKTDYVWIRKDELKDFIKNKPYLNCLMNFILDF